MHGPQPVVIQRSAQDQLRRNFNAMMVLMMLLALNLMGLAAAANAHSMQWTVTTGITSAVAALFLGLVLAANPYKNTGSVTINI